jgi:predicted ATPase
VALQLGQPGAELDALSGILAADPLRESTAAALARSLAMCGRQAEALDVLDRTRDRLADELGVDPGPELAATRLAVLRGVRPPRRSPPRSLTTFVGRDTDIRRITGLLDTARLVTLTGPGGAGKTRLAREVVDLKPDQAGIAELAPLGGADQLAAAVLAAVGSPEIVAHTPGETDTEARLIAALAGRDLLLVLDNCEHVVDGAARLAQNLLEHSPGLRVLATSREPLGVPGEMLHPVDALADDDAVQLFADRGAAVRPGFTMTDPLRPTAVRICRRLDGQPLAIELAAARLRTLTPSEIERRLDDRFRLLTTGTRTALPRHQTLRAVVDWSWDLLDEQERMLARRFAVFAGGALEEAAGQVCGLGNGTLDVLTALVDKSLLVADPHDGVTRYRMLETIRDYAGQKLDEAGERAAVEAAHAVQVLDLVETAEPLLRRPAQLEWVARLRSGSDDATAVLRRAVATGDAATAQRLVAATTWFWLIRGLFDEGTERLATAFALDGPAPVAVRALCTAYRAMVVAGEGDFATARAYVADAERLAAELPAERHPVLQLLTPFTVGFAHGDPGPLERLIADTGTDPWARAFAMFCRAQLAENEGDHERQHAETRAAHEIFTALGDRFGLGMTVSSLGDLENVAGDYDAAGRAFDEAIALATELGNDDDLPQFRAERARLMVRRGDVAAGRAELRQIVARPGLHPELIGNLHLYQADAARRAGDLDDARAALARTDPGSYSGPGSPQRRAVHAVTASAIAQAAGDRDRAAALLADAVAHALESRDGPVTATVAELAAVHALADGAADRAAVLLGVATAQRGAPDLGDPDVRACLAGLRAALGPAVAEERIRWGRELPRADGAALLKEHAGSLAARA